MNLFNKLESKLNLTILRNTIQISFGVFLLFVAWRFYGFINHFESGGFAPYVSKPGAVEGFLPVSAFMAFKLWLTEGLFDPFHPAGLVIFSTILLVAILFKKAFCSWICPIGTISEGLGRLGQKLFGRTFNLHKFIDYPMLGLKYLILLFFCKVIFIDMPSFAIIGFLRGEYNLIADVKMLKLFTNPSTTTVVVLVILGLLSILIKNFWCRYLCPYGALQGILSFLSPFKIIRNQEACIDCGLCTKACPNQIDVAKSSTVHSAECTACLDCIQVCPKKQALGLKFLSKKLSLRPMLFPVLVLAVWFTVIGYAKLTGHWDTTIPQEVFKELIPKADNFIH